jgi:hypothetical protein
MYPYRYRDVRTDAVVVVLPLANKPQTRQTVGDGSFTSTAIQVMECLVPSIRGVYVYPDSVLENGILYR